MPVTNVDKEAAVVELPSGDDLTLNSSLVCLHCALYKKMPDLIG